jgi:DNA phosphorothioation-dependent restriction protein DptG
MRTMTTEEKLRDFENTSKALQANILSSYEIAGQCCTILDGCPDDIIRPFIEMRKLLGTAWNLSLPSKQQLEKALTTTHMKK